MWSEFRFAARALGRWRGGAVVAILTLAIGIGTTTGLYALVRVMLADLPGIPEPERLGRIYAVSPSLRVERSPVAFNEFDATLSRAASFTSVGAYAESDGAVGAAPDARAVITGHASPSFFHAIGVPPVEGRVFVPADLESPQPVVVISHALWRREFPDGRLTKATIALDGIHRTVIGVMPPAFSYSFAGIRADLWIPLGPGAAPVVTVYARLRSGADWAAAGAELSRLPAGDAAWTWRAIPLLEDTRRRAVNAYALTLGPAAIVLLIACVNVACLLMARGLEREKELSVRRALGATRGRVIRLLLVENLLLALIAGALGGTLAVLLLRVIARALATVEPALAAGLAADTGLLPIAFVSSGLACLVFGVGPALRLTRRNVAAALTGVPAAQRIEISGYSARDAVVFAEVGSAVGLIVWAALLYTLSGAMGRVATAFDAGRIVAMRVPGRDAREVADRVAGVPGVARVAISPGMLGSRGRGTVLVRTGGGPAVTMARVPVGEGFLETLGVPILRGRSFNAAEHRAGPLAGAAILSESAARKLAPAGGALGMRLQLAGPKAPSLIVVGVCRDAIDYGPLSNAGVVPPDLYVPYDPRAIGEVAVLARVTTEPHGLLRAIAAAAQTPAGGRPARPIVLGDEARFGDSGSNLMFVRMMGVFAILGVLLAATGVFAVISRSVGQRTREFGIRIALGAAPGRVLGMVLARETRLIAAAVATGGIFAMSLTRALFVDLAAVGAVLPATWIGGVALAIAAAAIACALATWHIVRIEPAAVLHRH